MCNIHAEFSVCITIGILSRYESQKNRRSILNEFFCSAENLSFAQYNFVIWLFRFRFCLFFFARSSFIQGDNSTKHFRRRWRKRRVRVFHLKLCSIEEQSEWANGALNSSVVHFLFLLGNCVGWLTKCYYLLITWKEDGTIYVELRPSRSG